MARTSFIFTPLSYRNFSEVCQDHFGDETLYAYILSGGSPLAANSLVESGSIQEYVTQMLSDWIFGEFAAKVRSRAQLLAVLQSIYRMAGNPIGQAKLARESGLANNTVAQGYVELLADLFTILPAFPFDVEKEITIFRKPCKYHFINLLAAICWHPQKPRTIKELKLLGEGLGCVMEWTVAQELWRRACIDGKDEYPLFLNFWQSKTNEIDFIFYDDRRFFEVKSGSASPFDFNWFVKSFAKAKFNRNQPESFLY